MNVYETNYSSYEALITAISSCSVDTVQAFITENPYVVNIAGWHQQTPLHIASLSGNVVVLNTLLDAGSDPNSVNNFDETPLHYACRRGLPPMVYYLVKHDADIHRLDKAGKNVIHHAAEAGSVAVLHLLLCLQPDLIFTLPDCNLQTPLHLAIKCGQVDVFMYLVRNQRADLYVADKDGNLPVHISAQSGYGHMTWTLLRHMGLSALCLPNKHGYTLLELASMSDSTAHQELQQELTWMISHSKCGSVRQHCTIHWYFYLLLPVVSFAAAVVLIHLLPVPQCIILFFVVLLNANIMRTSHHRMPNVSRWPNPIYAGAFAGGIIHTLLVCFVVLRPYYTNRSVMCAAFYILTLCVCLMYIKLITTDPGILRSLTEVGSETQSIVDASMSEKTWQAFCTTCEMVPPLHTKHCRLCGHCMLGMDHHCLFLLRCIASGNHALFVYFMMLIVGCMALFLFGCGAYGTHLFRHAELQFVVQRLLMSDCWIFCLFLMNCTSLYWAVSVLVGQLYIVSNGYTAYFWQKRRSCVGHLTVCERVSNVGQFLLCRRLPIPTHRTKHYIFTA